MLVVEKRGQQLDAPPLCAQREKNQPRMDLRSSSGVAATGLMPKVSTRNWSTVGEIKAGSDGSPDRRFSGGQLPEGFTEIVVQFLHRLVKHLGADGEME